MTITNFEQDTRITSEFTNRFGENFRQNVPLRDYTTFQVGGPAKYFLTCKTGNDIVDAVEMALKYKLKYFLIGGGSNLLISDQGYSGLILFNATSQLEISNNHVIVDSGYNLEKLVDLLCQKGFGGLESLAGIKGTLGGAVYGNAGAFGKSISDALYEAELYKPGDKPRWEPNKYFDFSYRNSILKNSKEIVLRVKLNITKESSEELLKRQAEILKLRAEKHPAWNCSAGCFFKNIEAQGNPYGKLAAGMLLDKIGAKELNVGDARVSDKHANILINSGTASASDIRKLAAMLKKRVKDEFGYNLEEEITYLGD